VNKGHRIKWDVWLAITICALALFALFFIYPIVKIFANSVIDPETKRFTLEAFQKFFSRKYYTSTVWNSLKVTTLVTLLAATLGTAMAYVMRSIRIRGRGILEIFIIITVLSPPFIGAYSWILLLGRSGVVTEVIDKLFGIQFNGIYGFSGILLVLTLKLFPLIYLYVSGALKNMDNSLNEAAENLGTVGIRKIFKVVIPLILPTILAGSLLVFMRALADFGTPMLIGEGYRTLPVLIYTSFISEMGGDAAFASAISVIVVVITTIIFLSQKYVASRKTIEMSSLRPMEPKPAKGLKNVLAHLFVYLIVFLAALPQFVVIYTSFLKTNGRIFVQGFSFDSYISAFSKMGSSITNTYLYSIAAILIIVVIGTLVAYVAERKRNVLTGTLDTLTMIPYIIPGSVLGIALLTAFNQRPLLLSGTAFIIIAVFVIRRLPYTIRSSAAILHQISPSVEEAAQSLGATPLKTFRKVTLPMMVPGVMSGALMSWMSVISELSASIILYVGTTKTLTISIYTEVIRGNYGVAAALATILTATTVIALLIFFKLTGRKEIDM
jgi:iron(III) transport system permease protein